MKTGTPRSPGAGYTGAADFLAVVTAGKLYGSTEEVEVTHTDKQVRAVLEFLLSLEEESGFPERAREIAAYGTVESICQRRVLRCGTPDKKGYGEYFWIREDFVPGSEAGRPFDLDQDTFVNAVYTEPEPIETLKEWVERARLVGSTLDATERLRGFLLRCGFTGYDLALLDLADAASLEPIEDMAVSFPEEISNAVVERERLAGEIVFKAMAAGYRKPVVARLVIKRVRDFYSRVTPEGTRDEVLSRMTCSAAQASDAFGLVRRPLSKRAYCDKYGVDSDDYGSSLLSLVPERKPYRDKDLSLAEVGYAFAAANGRRYDWPES